MRGGAALLTLGLAVALAGGAFGQEVLDTREDLRGWEPVGQVEIGDAGYCTGTLIAPDLVLTAASCVIAADGAPVDAGLIRFRAGLIEGVALAESAVTRTIVPEGYENLDPVPLGMILKDVALLELATPVPTGLIAPFGIGAVTGGALSVVHYDEGRIEAPTLLDGCTLFLNRDGMVALDCGTGGLSSGAPMLEATGYRARIVGVVSAMTEWEGRQIAVGMDLPQVVADLREALRRGEATSRAGAVAPATGTKRITVGEDDGTGAKFLTP